MHSLTINQTPVPLQLKRIKGARYLRLRWHPADGSLRLSVPWRVSVKEALAFAQSRENWVMQQMAKEGVRQPLAEGSVFPFQGQNLTLHGTGKARGVVRLEGDRLWVPGDASFFTRRVTDWLKKHARERFDACAQRHARTLGVRITRITLRDTQSRWGSCSSSGALSFNWRLIMAPPEVLDYVAAHEVAHLKEMNHSPRYWAHVAVLCPDYETHIKWLKKHGTRLHTAV